MARTTIEDVKNIIDTDLPDTEIQAMIDTVSRLVDSVFANCSLSEDVLKDIETYLTAHIIASTKERQGSEEEAGTAKIKYTGKFGEGLSSTTYGQTALLLDTCGQLQNLGKKVASIKAVASEYLTDINRYYY